jgi:hypothetical protein
VRFCRLFLNLLLFAGLVGLTAGCPQPNKNTKKTGVVATSHPERGPHGAPLAAWADGHFLEVSIDRTTKEVAVFVFKGNSLQPDPIEIPNLTLTLTNVDPPAEVRLLPAPQEEDPKGSASCFRATNPAFAADEGIYGVIAGKVGDTEYLGEFDERARSPVPGKKRKK